MVESAHSIKRKPETPTPEVAHLLKLLDLQAAACRDQRAAGPKAFQGAAFRYGSLVAIIVFTLSAVEIMNWMVSQLPRPLHSTAVMTPPGKNANSSPIPNGTPALKE